MNTREKRVIVDYLFRYRWLYAWGLLIHFFVTAALWWSERMVLAALFGGSALVLFLEFSRGGNATARTLLSMPLTAGQIGRCWRFVALTLPVLLYFVALLVGAIVAAGLGAGHFSGERFVIVSVTQTLLLGFIFFALTGMPGQARAGRSLREVGNDLFFASLWGLSIPAMILVSVSLPLRWSDLTSLHWACVLALFVGTFAGWFRAGALVRKRVQRLGGDARRHTAALGDRRCGATSWRGYGALAYLAVRCSSILAPVFFFILLVGWLTMRLVGTSLSPGKPGITAGYAAVLIGMFLPIMAFVALVPLIGQLRVLRTVPLSRAALTNWLLMWPLAFVGIVGSAAVLLLSRLSGNPPDWSRFSTCLASAVLIQGCVPLILRFGFSSKALNPIFGIFVVAQTAAAAGGELGLDLASYWHLPLLGSMLMLAGIWIISYRLLASPHPWRAGLLKVPGMQRQT